MRDWLIKIKIDGHRVRTIAFEGTFTDALEKATDIIESLDHVERANLHTVTVERTK